MGAEPRGERDLRELPVRARELLEDMGDPDDRQCTRDCCSGVCVEQPREVRWGEFGFIGELVERPSLRGIAAEAADRVVQALALVDEGQSAR